MLTKCKKSIVTDRRLSASFFFSPLFSKIVYVLKLLRHAEFVGQIWQSGSFRPSSWSGFSLTWNIPKIVFCPFSLILTFLNYFRKKLNDPLIIQWWVCVNPLSQVRNLYKCTLGPSPWARSSWPISLKIITNGVIWLVGWAPLADLRFALLFLSFACVWERETNKHYSFI